MSEHRLEVTEIHAGFSVKCTCGATLPVVPKDHLARPVRRRCPHTKCRKRWKLSLYGGTYTLAELIDDHVKIYRDKPYGKNRR